MNKQIDFDNLGESIDTIKCLFEKRYNQYLLKKFKHIETNTNEYDFYDKLNNICENYQNIHFFTEDEIIDFLRSNYEFILAYHGSKQDNPEKILEEGLKLISYSDYIKISKEKFGEYANERTIEKQVEQFKQRIEKMEINFSGHPKFKGLHFFIYGSETLFSIAKNIDSKKCPELLRETGKPVIYKCLLPLELIPYEELIGIFKYMVLQCFQSYKKTNSPSTVNLTIRGDSLKKDYILDYFIPDEVMHDCHEDDNYYFYDLETNKNIYVDRTFLPAVIRELNKMYTKQIDNSNLSQYIAQDDVFNDMFKQAVKRGLKEKFK